MISPTVHARRRRQLAERLPDPVLLLGNGRRARNLPMNELPFRQDSTLLYFTGCTTPGAAALLEDGRCTLFVPAPSPDDPLWHGPVPTLDDVRARLGVDDVRPADELPARAAAARPRVVAVGDEARNREAAAWTGRALRFGVEPGDPDLIDAIVALRRRKDPEELAELRRAAVLTAEAHRFVMQATRPGVSERALAALFEAYLATRGATVGYATILTQRGEILHHHAHDGVCEGGRLLLLDGGAELHASGYGADVTRTWPVSGRFTPRQLAAYDAVLAAQEAALRQCRRGVPYLDVHLAACREIARFLLDEGLLRGVGVDEAVERGAHALFFPHGVGHLLGLDVHDLEAFGDRPAYPPGAARSAQFGLSYLRLDLPLEAGWVVTVEPGFYVVPAILADPVLRERFRGVVDLEVAAAWDGFGGIRTEDDVVITEGEPEILTAGAPKRADELEALVGSGAPLEALLA